MTVVRSRKSTSTTPIPSANEGLSAPTNAKNSSFKKASKLAYFGGVFLFSLVAGFGLGRLLYYQPNGSKSAASIAKPKLTIAMHHAGDPITLQRDGDIDSDACVLLSSCFPDRFFAARPDLNPDAPLTRCQRNLKILLNDFDSGFLYEGKRLVGFISSNIREATMEKAHQRSPVRAEVELYNVCIRQEDRGRGLARSLASMYVDELSAVNGFKTAWVGLDVDFQTPSAKEAFTLYAKMGFMRWWQPCRSINDFDFSQLESTPARFPAAWWFLNAAGGLKKEKFGGKTHFCMVKEWPTDEFYKIGAAVEAGINSTVE